MPSTQSPFISSALVTALVAVVTIGCSNKPVESNQPLFAPPAELMNSSPPADSAASPDWLKRMKVTRIQVWWRSGAIVYPSDGSVKSVEGKSAVYCFDIAPEKSQQRHNEARCEAVVFINSSTGHVWAGPRADYYLDTPEGIVGMWVFPGDVRWCDSGLHDLRPGDTLESLARRFEQQKLYIRLFDWPSSSCDPSPSGFVEPQFFDAIPGSSNPGMPHVSFRLHGQMLDMALDSPTYAFHARLLFDVKTRSLIKAVYDSGMETPPSILQHLVNDVPKLRPLEAGDWVSLRFGKHSTTGYYLLRANPSTQPADESNADLTVTLSWYPGGEQAQQAFQKRVAARHGAPPATQSEDEEIATCRWPDGYILQRTANRIVEIKPKAPLPKELPDALLQACLRRWTAGQSR